MENRDVTVVVVSMMPRNAGTRRQSAMYKNNPRLETKVVGSEGLEELQDTEEDTDEFGIHYIQKGETASEIRTTNWSTPPPPGIWSRWLWGQNQYRWS